LCYHSGVKPNQEKAMKPETETAVMKAHFEKSKKEAVTCLRA
jgi:hypothetical protein